jgi:hypothetical protein
MPPRGAGRLLATPWSHSSYQWTLSLIILEPSVLRDRFNSRGLSQAEADLLPHLISAHLPPAQQGPVSLSRPVHCRGQTGSAHRSRRRPSHICPAEAEQQVPVGRPAPRLHPRGFWCPEQHLLTARACAHLQRASAVPGLAQHPVTAPPASEQQSGGLQARPLALSFNARERWARPTYPAHAERRWGRYYQQHQRQYQQTQQHRDLREQCQRSEHAAPLQAQEGR